MLAETEGRPKRFNQKKLKKETVHGAESRAKDPQGMMIPRTQQPHRAITAQSWPERQEEGTARVCVGGGGTRSMSQNPEPRTAVSV